MPGYNSAACYELTITEETTCPGPTASLPGRTLAKQFAVYGGCGVALIACLIMTVLGLWKMGGAPAPEFSPIGNVAIH
jgi:hypothetical protein